METDVEETGKMKNTVIDEAAIVKDFDKKASISDQQLADGKRMPVVIIVIGMAGKALARI